MSLLTHPGANAKLAHGNGSTYAPYIMHLAPAKSSGHNTCPNASRECIALCLNTAGRARIFPMILEARKRKTRELFSDRKDFLMRLTHEIELAIRREGKKGRTAVFRLNGTSDLDFMEVVSMFPDTQFYDYTKDFLLFHRFLLGHLPSNYDLTFSFDGHNTNMCKSFLRRGGNVAVGFAWPVGTKYTQPSKWERFSTINGDESDLRFLDTKGKVVALKAKGKARNAKDNAFIIGS